MSGRADPRRVEAAVRAHSPALLTFFARRVDPAYEAADLLSETLLTLWRRAKDLPTRDDEVRPWMFGIAHRVLLHHYRGTVRRRAVADRLRSMIAAEPHAGFDDATEFDELHAALRALDPLDRDIIGLRHWEGFSLAEISRILKLNESTVRSRYHRARGALRAVLGEQQHASQLAAALPRIAKTGRADSV